jgi:hypothetical protein
MPAFRKIVLAALMGLAAALPAAAQPFDLSWHTFDGGGGMFSTGGSFSLGGTIGQPDAGVMTGGTFTLTGGFWAGAIAGTSCIGDANGDGQVNLTDLATLLIHFGSPSGQTFEDGDFDGDGDVDLVDLSNLLIVFGTSCP